MLLPELHQHRQFDDIQYNVILFPLKEKFYLRLDDVAIFKYARTCILDCK